MFCNQLEIIQLKRKAYIMRRGREIRETRRQQAEALKDKRNSRSIGEQLALLAKRPGNSTKEKSRLLILLKKKNE